MVVMVLKVAVLLTEIFYSSKWHLENKGDQEFKYTEFTLGSTLGTCTLSPSLTPPKFTEIVNLECHRMHFEASNQW